MAEGEKEGSETHAIYRIAAQMGPFGYLTILWTTIFCVLLLKGDGRLIDRHWLVFYCTWTTLAGLWLLSVGAVSFGAWMSIRAREAAERKARARLPVPSAVAHPPGDKKS